MIRCLRRLFPLLSFVLAACAVPPAMTPVALAPLAPGMARIVFYRDANPYDPANVLTVSLNGAPIGSLPRGDAIYRDVAPGTYTITFNPTRVIPYQFKAITPGAGNVFYVKLVALQDTDCSGTIGTIGACDISGFTALVVDPVRAQQEMTRLSLVRG